VSTAKSLFIHRESGVWGSLRSQRAALAESNERLAQRSTEVADLRLLRDELKSEVAVARAEAALARTEMQQRQLELGQVIGEWDQSRSQAPEAVGRAEALRGQLAEAMEQLAEASARAGTLAEDLAVAVGSAQSAQAVASQERAWAEGMFRPLCDLDTASFFNPCLKNFVRLPVESVKALAQAVEQKEADHVAMSEAISDFCRAFDLDDVPSGSSPQSHLRALGGHVRSRLRGALHHGVRRAFVVLASHYDVDLERVSEGYCLPDEDEAALAEVQRLDTAAAGPSAMLASSFEVEILPPASPSGAGPDLAEGGDDAEGGPANV
jgi:multidrug efflux pump subunit AcrA (membrane-fusion protein)